MMSTEKATAVLPELEEPCCCSKALPHEHCPQEQASEHRHKHHHQEAAHNPASLNRTALMATMHCRPVAQSAKCLAWLSVLCLDGQTDRRSR